MTPTLDPNYDHFSGSDVDVDKWEPKLPSDEFDNGSGWECIGAGNWPKFHSSISYRRFKPCTFGCTPDNIHDGCNVHSSGASIVENEQPKDFETWFRPWEAARLIGHADTLPIWAIEKMKTAWNAARTGYEPASVAEGLRRELKDFELNLLASKGNESELIIERDALRKELAEVKAQHPKSFDKAPDCLIMACGHNSYWRTRYGNCMACRVDRANAERDQLQQQLSTLQSDYANRLKELHNDTVRLTQERDEAKEFFKKCNNSVVECSIAFPNVGACIEQLEQERDALAAKHQAPVAPST